MQITAWETCQHVAVCLHIQREAFSSVTRNWADFLCHVLNSHGLSQLTHSVRALFSSWNASFEVESSIVGDLTWLKSLLINNLLNFILFVNIFTPQPEHFIQIFFHWLLEPIYPFIPLHLDDQLQQLGLVCLLPYQKNRTNSSSSSFTFVPLFSVMMLFTSNLEHPIPYVLQSS